MGVSVWKERYFGVDGLSGFCQEAGSRMGAPMSLLARGTSSEGAHSQLFLATTRRSSDRGQRFRDLETWTSQLEMCRGIVTSFLVLVEK